VAKTFLPAGWLSHHAHVNVNTVVVSFLPVGCVLQTCNRRLHTSQQEASVLYNVEPQVVPTGAQIGFSIAADIRIRQISLRPHLETVKEVGLGFRTEP